MRPPISSPAAPSVPTPTLTVDGINAVRRASTTVADTVRVCAKMMAQRQSPGATAVSWCGRKRMANCKPNDKKSLKAKQSYKGPKEFSPNSISAG